MRAMYAGISGMKVNQTKLDVIGNNIANVGTTAFKGSRARFQDSLSQAEKSATAPSTSLGGTNSSDVGLGVQLAGIDRIMGQGNMQPTGRALDCAIDGNGFFMVSKGDKVFDEKSLQVNQSAGSHNLISQSAGNSDMYYTRDGAFTLDQEGNLLTANGYRVMGYGLTNGDNTEKPTAQAPQSGISLDGLNFTFGPGSQLNGYSIALGTISEGTIPSAYIDKANSKIVISGDFNTPGALTAEQIKISINKALSGAGIVQNAYVTGTPQLATEYAKLKVKLDEAQTVVDEAKAAVNTASNNVDLTKKEQALADKKNTEAQNTLTTLQGATPKDQVAIDAAKKIADEAKATADAAKSTVEAAEKLVDPLKKEVDKAIKARDKVKADIEAEGKSLGIDLFNNPLRSNAFADGTVVNFDNNNIILTPSGKALNGFHLELGNMYNNAEFSVKLDTQNKNIIINGLGNKNNKITKDMLQTAINNTLSEAGISGNVTITACSKSINLSGEDDIKLKKNKSKNSIKSNKGCYLQNGFTLDSNQQLKGGTPVESIKQDGVAQFVDGAEKINSFDGSLKTLRIPQKVQIPGTDTFLRVKSFNIDKQGVITAQLEGGKVAALGQIAMVSFSNPEGLTDIGKNLYTSSVNSGTATLRTGIGTTGADNSEGFGSIMQGALEMSNVDLAQQFTDMIVTTRAFQANGKMITTGDEILQDVINLKR